MGIAQDIAGKLVADEDMHPMVNIYGRKWIAGGDMSGEYRGTWPTRDGMKPPRLFWVFDSE